MSAGRPPDEDTPGDARAPEARAEGARLAGEDNADECDSDGRAAGEPVAADERDESERSAAHRDISEPTADECAPDDRAAGEPIAADERDVDEHGANARVDSERSAAHHDAAEPTAEAEAPRADERIAPARPLDAGAVGQAAGGDQLARQRPALFALTDRAFGPLAVRDDPRVMRWYVPGRIELLGKHTDYAGGRSLLCAVERGFCVTAVARTDNRLRIVDVLASSEAELRVSPDQADMPHWRNYPATVARRLARNFGDSGDGPLRGADIALASDLPRSSGLSSSSALIIAIFSVLAEVNALDRQDAYAANIADDDALASYLGCIENGRTFGTLAGDRGVGTHGGSQDHLAIVGSVPGQLVACTFSPVRRERFLPVPEGYAFAIASSGVTASKTGQALERYNRAAASVAAMLATWRRATGREDATLFDALVSEPSALERLRALLRKAGQDALLGRLEQFRLETFDLIPGATVALAGGDVETFGALVDRSQRAAVHLLGNQVPETVALAAIARDAGAAAASAFGAGFGGSVWALVRAADTAAFLADWRARYLARFPGHAVKAQFFSSGAGAGRHRLDTSARS